MFKIGSFCNIFPLAVNQKLDNFQKPFIAKPNQDMYVYNYR